MYVKPEEIAYLEEKYGRARRLNVEPIRMFENEHNVLVASMKNGRRHDVTMFIRMDGSFVCIQKHMYKGTGIYRAPSGGIHPGESLEAGLVREMKEETGLDVRTEHFLLIVNSSFIGPRGGRTDWVSYVFSGAADGGELAPVDEDEICEVRLVNEEELAGGICERMTGMGLGGFIYRAILTREALAELRRRTPG
ncbi:MAG: NUDIX hydrolase [bacterium]